LIAVDTNILIYATDRRAGDKYLVAKSLLATAMAAKVLMLPLQVLVEFAHSAVRKIKHPPEAAAQFVLAWSAVARVEAYHLDDVRTALRARSEHGLPFWDALIWAVCERSGVRTLVTEDFQDGRPLGRVTFLDPFKPDSASRLDQALR
jgi:predicted nucleic acid-binding protein